LYDLIIVGARVIDGTGGPAYFADVAVAGGRIVRISRRPAPPRVQAGAGLQYPSREDAGPGAGQPWPGAWCITQEGQSWPGARNVFDARGLCLAPGFIDIHNHSDLTILADPRAESMVSQGVTTVVVGNCGFSPAPWPGPEGGENAVLMQEDAAFLACGFDVPWRWRSFGDYLRAVQASRPAVNVVALVGHGVIREQVLGRATRAPDRAEMRRMQEILGDAMADGAAGMSSGLIYYPGCYAGTEELVELARVVAQAGGVYASHIRGEGETLLDAVAEAIEIARRAGVSTQISHLKAESRFMWGRLGEALAMIDAARQEGLAVDCDQYPYTAYNTSLGSFLPPQVMEGDWRKVLASRRGREEIRRIMAEGTPDWTSSVRGMEWSDFVVDGTGDPSTDGRDLAALASGKDQDAWTLFFDLLLEYGPHVRVIGHAMREDDVAKAVARPDVMVGSDGYALPLEGDGHPHPRSFGTFPRVLGRYSREEGVISLEAAVRKMTGLPAAKLGFRDRGLVHQGYWADLVLFDPHLIQDTATFEQPWQRPRGIVHVLVNGQPASARAGRVLSSTPT